MKFVNFSFLFSIFALSYLGGCTTQLNHRGKLPDPTKLAQIKPGIHSKEDVLRLVGSPTNQGIFNDESWIYVHKITKSRSFLEPEVLEQKLTIINFDSRNLVKEIIYKDGQGQEITPVNTVITPAGEKSNSLQQIFGNFGRFSKKSGDK